MRQEDICKEHADRVRMTTWLCTNAKNLYISHLRKEKRRADIEPDDISADTDMSFSELFH